MTSKSFDPSGPPPGWLREAAYEHESEDYARNAPPPEVIAALRDRRR